MKKNKDRQAEEKLAPQYGFRKLRPTKIPKLAWVSLALSFVLAALMFAMYAMSLNSAKNTRKTLLIYSDGTTIPMVSMRNSLASAGLLLMSLVLTNTVQGLIFSIRFPKIIRMRK